ncbi:NUDIX hydrolase [Aestuariivirga sp.]|uniref:NUDIX hydrolase n=1 Tax=Aestuariivirga sp. TaxID=2650926 RepID=UPI0039E4C44C
MTTAKKSAKKATKQAKRGGHARQHAALPWRDRGGLEILLISSRDTKRWVIPKGWPMAGLNASETAEREAFEESGLRGLIAPTPVGIFHYVKRLAGGVHRNMTVDVYPLEVRVQTSAWPEMHQRTLKWMTPDEAAAAVQEPELSALIRSFARLKSGV